MFRLITISDVKQFDKGRFLTPAGADDDTFDYLLGDIIIPAVGREFAFYCGRPDFDKAARTEYLSPRRYEYQRHLFLQSPPVAPGQVGPPLIEALRLYQDTNIPRAYGAETELVNGTDFFVHEAEGVIEHAGCGFTGGPKAVKVTYTGGYLTDDAAGCPEDLRMIAAEYAYAQFCDRDKLNFAGASTEGGSVSFAPGPRTLPQWVTMVLNNYRIIRV